MTGDSGNPRQKIVIVDLGPDPETCGPPSFGMIFRAAMREQGHSEKEAAAMLGLSERQIQRWESDDSYPRKSRWHEVAAYMGFEVGDDDPVLAEENWLDVVSWKVFGPWP